MVVDLLRSGGYQVHNCSVVDVVVDQKWRAVELQSVTCDSILLRGVIVRVEYCLLRRKWCFELDFVEGDEVHCLEMTFVVYWAGFLQVEHQVFLIPLFPA